MSRAEQIKRAQQLSVFIHEVDTASCTLMALVHDDAFKFAVAKRVAGKMQLLEDSSSNSQYRCELE